MTIRQPTDYAPRTKSPGSLGGPGSLGHRLEIDDIAVPGEPRPYAFLKQLPLRPFVPGEPSSFGDVTVRITPLDVNGSPLPPGSNWHEVSDWEFHTTDHQIALQCIGRWFAQAACEAGLTEFSVTNAEGMVFHQQLPAGKQSLHGEFGGDGDSVPSAAQGFRVATIKQVVLNWAQDPGNHAGNIISGHDFGKLTGGRGQTALDRLHLVVRCKSPSGQVVILDDYYYPVINWRVDVFN